VPAKHLCMSTSPHGLISLSSEPQTLKTQNVLRTIQMRQNILWEDNIKIDLQERSMLENWAVLILLKTKTSVGLF
jgi:hypothetical protein